MVTRLESEGASPPEAETAPYLEQEARKTFDAGLTVLLDGIEAAVKRAGV